MANYVDKIANGELSPFDVIESIRKGNWPDKLITELLDDMAVEAIWLKLEPTAANCTKSDRLSKAVDCVASVYLPKYDKLRKPDIWQDQDNSYFTTSDKKDTLIAIFNRLIKGGYIDSESNLEDWLIICGAERSKKRIEPINWLKRQNMLAWLIHVMFTSTLRCWEIAAECFRVNGEVPNINSMKNAVSKVKTEWVDKPDDFVTLEELLDNKDDDTK